MPNIEGDDGAARAYYIIMSLTFIYDGNSKGSIVHATEIALSRDCVPVPRDLEIANWLPCSFEIM